MKAEESYLFWNFPLFDGRIFVTIALTMQTFSPVFEINTPVSVNKKSYPRVMLGTDEGKCTYPSNLWQILVFSPAEVTRTPLPHNCEHFALIELHINSSLRRKQVWNEVLLHIWIWNDARWMSRASYIWFSGHYFHLQWSREAYFSTKWYPKSLCISSGLLSASSSLYYLLWRQAQKRSLRHWLCESLGCSSKTSPEPKKNGCPICSKARSVLHGQLNKLPRSLVLRVIPAIPASLSQAIFCSICSLPQHTSADEACAGYAHVSVCPHRLLCEYVFSCSSLWDALAESSILVRHRARETRRHRAILVDTRPQHTCTYGYWLCSSEAVEKLFGETKLALVKSEAFLP